MTVWRMSAVLMWSLVARSVLAVPAADETLEYNGSGGDKPDTSNYKLNANDADESVSEVNANNCCFRYINHLQKTDSYQPVCNCDLSNRGTTKGFAEPTDRFVVNAENSQGKLKSWTPNYVKFLPKMPINKNTASQIEYQPLFNYNPNVQPQMYASVSKYPDLKLDNGKYIPFVNYLPNGLWSGPRPLLHTTEHENRYGFVVPANAAVASDYEKPVMMSNNGDKRSVWISRGRRAQMKIPNKNLIDLIHLGTHPIVMNDRDMNKKDSPDKLWIVRG